MKRRRFMHYVQAGLITSLSTGIATHWQSSPAQAAGSLSIRWLGHTCFLFSGNGTQVLVNPFRPTGCTAKYPAPQASANIVLISSRLLDEGVVEGLAGKPKLLFEPGAYKAEGLQFQGIRTLHDRVNGYRFGTNVAWKWVQGGVNVVHLGGIASPISVEQKILMGRPDVLLIPVGGSAKAYTPEEAKAAIQTLNPKVVIPTHYKTAAADTNTCDLQSVEDFLSLMQGATIRRVGGNGITISANSLPSSGQIVQVLSY